MSQGPGAGLPVGTLHYFLTGGTFLLDAHLRLAVLVQVWPATPWGAGD